MLFLQKPTGSREGQPGRVTPSLRLSPQHWLKACHIRGRVPGPDACRFLGPPGAGTLPPCHWVSSLSHLILPFLGAQAEPLQTAPPTTFQPVVGSPETGDWHFACGLSLCSGSCLEVLAILSPFNPDRWEIGVCVPLNQLG